MYRLPVDTTILRAIFIFFTVAVLFHFNFSAQAISGVTISFDVQGENIQPGDIIITEEGNYLKSRKVYENFIFGVVIDDPSIALNDVTLDEGTYVVTTGEAFVRITAENGNIKAGDYITTSSQEGVAMLATKSGQVLGVALEDYAPTNPDEVGQIWAYIDIAPVITGGTIEQNAFEMLRSGISAPFLSPMTSLRFLLAFIVIIVSFFLGFVSFSRITGNSIQALGRNPLASSVIKSSVIMNFMFTVAVIMVGVGVAYLILSV